MKKGLAAILAACAMLSYGCGGDKPAPKAEQKTAAQEASKAVDDLSATKDGTYTAESHADEWGKGRLTIIIKDHKITAAEFLGVKPDGKIKDETYGTSDGEIKNEGKYKKAQNALKAHEKYAAQLVERQKVSDVDAIAGATVSYNQFVEAAQNAIEQSKK